MIVSVSRRSDIPAFYSDWFFNRLKEGVVYVANPMNPKQVSEIELSPETVDCFVFWTKNVEPMLNRLDELNGYKYYFQYTITSYGRDVESGVLDKVKVIESFKKLSNKIGKNRVILRYDPILLSNKYTIDYHCRAFEKLCSQLHEYTNKCVISFVDLYKKTERNTRNLNLIEMTQEDIRNISKKLSEIAKKYNLLIETCSEGIDLTEFGIEKGKCIDDRLISEVIGYKVDVKKDDTQREVCGCMKSVDIGQYNTCKHHCLYCYANFNYAQVEDNFKKHNPKGKLLVGEVRSDAKITKRKMKSIKKEQFDLFDYYNKY